MASEANEPGSNQTGVRRSSVPIAVLGAGSWGTALAIQFARTSRPTILWARDATQLEALERDRCNKRYLPDAPFPAALSIERDLATVLTKTQDIVVSVPSHALRGMLQDLVPLRTPKLRIAWATKGFELATGLLPHQVAEQL